MKMNNFRFNKLYQYNQEAKGTPVKDSKSDEDSKITQKLRRNLSGKSLSTIDKEFYSYIFELLNTASLYTQEEKNQTAEDIIEYYFTQTGNQMKNQMLTALADFLLDSTLADPCTSKVQKEEFPVLSFRQLDHRQRREIGVEADILEIIDNRRRHPKNKRQTSERSENK